MKLVGTLTGTGSIPLANSLLTVEYVIEVSEDSDGIRVGKGTLACPSPELFAFIASDGDDLRLETGDKIKIEIRNLRGREAEFSVVGSVPGF